MILITIKWLNCIDRKRVILLSFLCESIHLPAISSIFFVFSSNPYSKEVILNDVTFQ